MFTEGMHLPEGEWQKMKVQEEEEMSELRKIYDKKIKDAHVSTTVELVEIISYSRVFLPSTPRLTIKEQYDSM
jgi:hypothetical protein